MNIRSRYRDRYTYLPIHRRKRGVIEVVFLFVQFHGGRTGFPSRYTPVDKAGFGTCEVADQILFPTRRWSRMSNVISFPIDDK